MSPEPKSLGDLLPMNPVDFQVLLVLSEGDGHGYGIVKEIIDLKSQRYRWRQNMLEIAARYPSLTRYLGFREAGFPGQETRHFRLLLAEIVAEAVCAKLLEGRSRPARRTSRPPPGAPTTRSSAA